MCVLTRPACPSSVGARTVTAMASPIPRTIAPTSLDRRTTEAAQDLAAEMGEMEAMTGEMMGTAEGHQAETRVSAASPMVMT